MAEDDAKSKAKPEAEPDGVSGDVSGAEPGNAADSAAKAKPQSADERGPAEPSEAEPDAKADAGRKDGPKLKVRAKADVAADAEPAGEPSGEPAVESQSAPEVRPKRKGAKRPEFSVDRGPVSDRKVALVTGASGGIGEAFARKLAADGYALVLVARSDGELNRVAGQVTAEHDLPVAALPIDLTRSDAADEVEKEFRRRNIVPEIVVNNAGFGLNGPVADLGRERQIDIVDLNIRALTDLSLRFLPTMRERGRGGIINIASTAAYLPGPYMAVYYASKAYVLSFSEALATELKGSGINVTTVCPGPTATGFQAEAGMEKAALVKLFPMMSAEEVADLGYAGFQSGKRVVIPGVMNRIIAATAPMIPNGLMLPIVRMLQGPKS